MINPAIFAKKTYVKSSKSESAVVALEHILALVVKMYYKASFKIQDYLELFSLREDEDQRISLPHRNKRKETDKKKRGKQTDGVGAKDGSDNESQSDDDDVVQYEGNLTILERLISPLCTPYEFGRSASRRALVAPRNSHI